MSRKLFSPPSVPITFFWLSSVIVRSAWATRASSWFLLMKPSRSCLWSPVPKFPSELALALRLRLRLPLRDLDRPLRALLRPPWPEGRPRLFSRRRCRRRTPPDLCPRRCFSLWSFRLLCFRPPSFLSPLPDCEEEDEYDLLLPSDPASSSSPTASLVFARTASAARFRAGEPPSPSSSALESRSRSGDSEPSGASRSRSWPPRAASSMAGSGADSRSSAFALAASALAAASAATASWARRPSHSEVRVSKALRSSSCSSASSSSRFRNGVADVDKATAMGGARRAIGDARGT
mmetsp:Transcript_104271/g.299859  ORF Transcript_104271/g.299859 Transcript_104271/m.299859 type:complete len:293 (-) Transcript_104271:4-882(-)